MLSQLSHYVKQSALIGPWVKGTESHSLKENKRRMTPAVIPNMSEYFLKHLTEPFRVPLVPKCLFIERFIVP